MKSTGSGWAHVHIRYVFPHKMAERGGKMILLSEEYSLRARDGAVTSETYTTKSRNRKVQYQLKEERFDGVCPQKPWQVQAPLK